VDSLGCSIELKPFFSILQLETQFPRPIGDAANPLSHHFPVEVSVIPKATVDAVIYEPQSIDAQQLLVSAIVDLALSEIARGAIVVGTSCGFLGAYQTQIAQQLPVPFLSSSLTHLPRLSAAIDANTGVVGILTFDAEVLTNAQWFKQLAPPQHVIVGLPKEGHLYRVIKNNQTKLDIPLAQQDVLSAALSLKQMAQIEFGLPLSLVLFECTNLGPYRQAVIDALGCPVIDYNALMAQAWSDACAKTI
jgi:hypothetical protein